MKNAKLINYTLLIEKEIKQKQLLEILETRFNRLLLFSNIAKKS